MIHDISDSGNTTFIEPEILVELSNKVVALRIEEKEEIYRLLKELTQEVCQYSSSILANNKLIGELDYISSKSEYGNKHNCVVPTFSKERLISLKERYTHLLTSQRWWRTTFILMRKIE